MCLPYWCIHGGKWLVVAGTIKVIVENVLACLGLWGLGRTEHRVWASLACSQPIGARRAGCGPRLNQRTNHQPKTTSSSAACASTQLDYSQQLSPTSRPQLGQVQRSKGVVVMLHSPQVRLHAAGPGPVTHSPPDTRYRQPFIQPTSAQQHSQTGRAAYQSDYGQTGQLNCADPRVMARSDLGFSRGHRSTTTTPQNSTDQTISPQADL